MKWEIILVESVNGSSLTLERIHDIQGGHRLPLRVFGVGHSVFDHILQKGLDHRSGFLVNLTRDPLHSTSPRQTTNRWLRDSGNISFAAFTESFSSSLSQTFASFSSSGHIECVRCGVTAYKSLRSNDSFAFRSDLINSIESNRCSDRLAAHRTNAKSLETQTPTRRSTSYYIRIAHHWPRQLQTRTKSIFDFFIAKQSTFNSMYMYMSIGMECDAMRYDAE